MTSPNQPPQVGPGVLCEVVGGIEGENSPNLGLFVRVTRYVGYREKSKPSDPHFGRVWEAEAEYAEAPASQYRTRKIDPGKRDFLEHWLKPVPGQPGPGATTDTKKEVEA